MEHYPNDFMHNKINNFDPCNEFLAIATNIPQRLKTGFMVQGHILSEYHNIRKYNFQTKNMFSLNL